MGSVVDSEAGSALGLDLGGSASAGSGSFLDLASASIRSFSADAGAADLAGVSAGIRGGEGTLTIPIRTGVDTDTAGTTIRARTVLT